MQPKILTGWKEIAQELGGYHPDHLRRLFRSVRERIKLRYWFGIGHRIKMTQEEAQFFKEIVKSPH